MRRIEEAERLRKVWQAGIPGSLPVAPWPLLDIDQQSRWLGKLADAADIFAEEP